MMEDKAILALAEEITDWLQAECRSPAEALTILSAALAQLIATQAPSPEGFTSMIDKIGPAIRGAAISMRKSMEEASGHG